MKALAILLLLSNYFNSTAQEVYGSLSGTVCNAETKKPIQTSLKLFTSESVFVSQVRSNNIGQFNLVGIKKGKYYLKAGNNGNGGIALYFSGPIEIPKQSRIKVYLTSNPLLKHVGPIEFFEGDSIILY